MNITFDSTRYPWMEGLSFVKDGSNWTGPDGSSWTEPSWNSSQVIIAEWVCFGIAIVAVAIRLYIQRGIISRRPWGEFYALLSLILFFGNCICYTLQSLWHYYDYSPVWMYAPVDDIWNPSLRVGWAKYFMYLSCIYACKASLLCLYSDIAPREAFPKIRVAIIVTWVLLFIGVAMHAVWNIFQCWPISANFYYWTAPGAACYQDYVQGIVVWTWHCLTDLCVYAIPFAITWRLSRRQKWEVGLLFGFGFINVCLAIYGLAICANLSTADGAAQGGFIFSHLTQQTTAIVILCAPHIRRFLREHRPRRVCYRAVFWRKRRSSIDSKAVKEMYESKSRDTKHSSGDDLDRACTET